MLKSFWYHTNSFSNNLTLMMRQMSTIYTASPYFDIEMYTYSHKK